MLAAILWPKYFSSDSISFHNIGLNTLSLSTLSLSTLSLSTVRSAAGHGGKFGENATVIYTSTG